MAPIHHLAVDLGANGGKVFVGRLTPEAVDLREVHRFDNRPVRRDGRYVWDIDRLVAGVEDGVRAGDAAVDALDSVAVDTWGLDSGLLRDGHLLADPYSYRDPGVSATREALLDAVGRRTVFDATGIANWHAPNTLFQYHALATREPDRLAAADRLVMLPQVVSHRLGAEPVGEVTVASTTQMLDVREGAWATGLLERLDLPRHPLPELRSPGDRIGSLAPALARGLSGDPDLRLPASHDTAAAVAGLPLSSDSPAFLSTGTWFLVGVELPEPLITDAAFAAGASNELGVDGTARFLRNVNGFFLLEECRASWRAAGAPHDYDRLLAAAADAAPFGPLVNPDDPLFGIEGDMVEHVRTYCRRTGQRVPGDRGAVVRCVLESLATRTALVLERLLDAAGETTEALHVGGGGVRNDLFCRLLARAVERPVAAGPVEATAAGNLLVQARATGAVDDLAAGRRAIREHAPPTRYEPAGDDGWAAHRSWMADLVEITVGEG